MYLCPSIPEHIYVHVPRILYHHVIHIAVHSILSSLSSIYVLPFQVDIHIPIHVPVLTTSLFSFLCAPLHVHGLYAMHVCVWVSVLP